MNWVGLDPSRHLFLYTEKTFRALAEEANFAVDEVVYDSTDFYFWAGEQYLLDIHLIDERSHVINPDKSVFTKDQINAYDAEAMKLNAR